jgi:hypothetical protein
MEDGLLERTLLVSKEDPRKAYADYKVKVVVWSRVGEGMGESWSLADSH